MDFHHILQAPCLRMLRALALLALWASPSFSVARAEEIAGQCEDDRAIHFIIDERTSADEVSALQTTFQVSEGQSNFDAQDIAVDAKSPTMHSSQSNASLAFYHSDVIAANRTTLTFERKHGKEQKKHKDQVTKIRKLHEARAVLMSEGVRSSREASSSTFFVDWPIDMAIGFVVIALLTFIVMVHELYVGEFEGEYGTMTPRETRQARKLMRVVEACRVTMASCDYTFIIPLSLQLSLALGYSTIISGFMVGSFAIGTLLGSILSIKVAIRLADRGKRRLLVLALVFVAVSECALSCAMYVPSFQQSKWLTITMILVRVLGGFAAGWGGVSFLMLSTVNSPQEQSGLETFLPIADFFGLALGFGLTALCTRGGNHDPEPFKQCAPALMLIAGGNAILALLVSYWVPMSSEPFSYHGDETPPETLTNNAVIIPDILAAKPHDVLKQQNRGALAIIAFFQVAASSLCTTGVELGTSYILEVDMGWGPTWVALGQFGMFIAAMIVVIILTWLRSHLGTAYDVTILVPASLATIAATVFYFPHSTSDMVKFHLLIGDSFVYPTATVITGVIAGYAYWAANKERWNYRQNIVLTIQVTDGLAKFGGAPFVRGLIMDQGRTSYAILQLALVIFSLLSFLWARNVEMYIEKADLEAVVPDGRGFVGNFKHKVDRFLEPFRDPTIKS